MKTLDNWHVVCKSTSNHDLSFWMPYPCVLRLQMSGYKVEPIFIGEIDGRKTILSLDKYLERNYIQCNGEEIELGDFEPDFEKIVKTRNNTVYDWKIDADLFISGYLYKDGELIQFKDEIIKQDGDILTLKDKKEIFLVWNAMSIDMQQALNSFTDEERVKLCPENFGEIKNCKMDLTLLIKNKEEREKRKKAFDAIDVPNFFKN